MCFVQRRVRNNCLPTTERPLVAWPITELKVGLSEMSVLEPEIAEWRESEFLHFSSADH